LTDALPAPRRAGAAGALAIACAISLLLMTPVRAFQAWRYVAPYAAANAAIQHASADVVLIDHASAVLFDMGTVTRNDPFLVHKPQVMALGYLNEALLRQLCATHSVAVFDGSSAAQFGINTIPWQSSPGVVRLRQVMAELNCGRPMKR
jgi:hypothetical protein